MPLDKGREITATHFFFTFGEQDHVDRQRAARRQVCFERFDVQEELAFVVDRSARVDAPVAHGGLEWRGGPEVERLSRLHVVVPVNEYGLGSRRRSAPFAEDDRMAAGRQDLSLQSGGPWTPPATRRRASCRRD